MFQGKRRADSSIGPLQFHHEPQALRGKEKRVLPTDGLFVFFLKPAFSLRGELMDFRADIPQAGDNIALHDPEGFSGRRISGQTAEVLADPVSQGRIPYADIIFRRIV